MRTALHSRQAHSAPSAPSPSVVAESIALLRMLMVTVGNRVRLLGFELQIAGLKLAAAASLLVIALFLVGTAWAALWFGIAMALRSIDLSWPVVLGLIFAINVLGVALSLRAALGLVRQASLPATLRQLSFADSDDDDDVSG